MRSELSPVAHDRAKKRQNRARDGGFFSARNKELTFNSEYEEEDEQ